MTYTVYTHRYREILIPWYKTLLISTDHPMLLIEACFHHWIKINKEIKKKGNCYFISQIKCNHSELKGKKKSELQDIKLLTENFSQCWDSLIVSNLNAVIFSEEKKKLFFPISDSLRWSQTAIWSPDQIWWTFDTMMFSLRELGLAKKCKSTFRM